LPNTKSAEKRVRQNERRRAANRGQRSAMRTQIKKARAAVESAGAGMAEVLVETQSTLDKAASRNLLHKNKAARLKSRLARDAAKAQAG
jgi:small subunit ribosomal protein S20